MKNKVKICLDCHSPAVYYVGGIGGLCQAHANALLVSALIAREHNKMVAKKKKLNAKSKKTKMQKMR
jgi:hypothetical protein